MPVCYSFNRKSYPFNVEDPRTLLPKYIKRIKGRLLRRSKWTPRVGDLVVGCYDGKRFRMTFGMVEKVSHMKMTLRFVPWPVDPNTDPHNTSLVPQTFKVTRSPRGYFFGYLTGPCEIGIMRMLGLSGDYYSIHPLALTSVLGDYDQSKDSDKKNYLELRESLRKSLLYLISEHEADKLLDAASA